jgi:uncharacterized membrane protein
VLRHWLALFIAAWTTFTAIPVAAPFLDRAGHHRLAGLIYGAYRYLCHQLPHRSFFIGGRHVVYGWREIYAQLGIQSDSQYALLFHPVRDPVLGYQTALCQRDLGIYTALTLTAVAFAVVRRRRDVRPLPWRGYLMFVFPAALDGFTQLFGLRDSTPALRVITGAFFGVGTGLLVLPSLELGVREILELAGAPGVLRGPAASKPVPPGLGAPEDAAARSSPSG